MSDMDLARYQDAGAKRVDLTLADGRPAVAVTNLPGTDPYTAVFVADMIPTVAHLDASWIMGYDLYPMDPLAFKRTFVREAIEREYLIIFEHDPVVRAAYIREKDGCRYVEPVLS